MSVELDPAAPAIKASYFQANVAALELLGPQRDHIEEIMASEIAATQRASRADWLPMAWDQKLSRVVAEVAGPQAVVVTNRGAFVAAAAGPFLRPIIQGTIRVFGVTPKALLRSVDRAWRAGSKNAGYMDVEIGESDGWVHHRDMQADEVWYLGLVGVLEGILEVTGFEGTATMSLAPDGHPVYHCRWTHRKQSA
jgi:hypothetical protein